MPADLTKSNSTRPRRPTRKDSEDRIYELGHTREIELKRSRGEISCAECRRLKIKCDKQIPCQSCVRRGCEILCPNDCFTTGQGTRSVIEATGHLYTQIKRLTERNRDLEAALEELQGQVSSEPHPLLQKHAAAQTAARIAYEGSDLEDDPSDSSSSVLNSFGTLSISDNGASRFIGPTGGSESLLISGDDRAKAHRNGASPSDDLRPSLPAEMMRFSASFPFTPLGPPPAVLDLIDTYLPPWERAMELCDIYLEGAAWLFHAIPRVQLMDELLPAIYKRPSARDWDGSCSAGAHDYALLFTVFSVGTLVDLRHGPRDAEAEHYFQIASAAVCVEAVLERPSLVTVQAVHLMSIYNAMSPDGRDTRMETTWQLVALGARLALSIGLHKDSARWGLPYRMVQRRRFIFWDLFLADGWQSLASGRPPAFSLSYVDCKFPDENDPTKENESAGEREFESWGYRFSAECISEIIEKVLGATMLTYATVLELDRKVREFPMPQYAAPMTNYDVRDPETGRLALSESMQRFCMSNVRETALLYIHRSFFAQAIIDHPEDPLKSRYAQSFIAAYNASSVILNTISDQYEVCPDLVARFWIIWTYAFSAAVVFGTVVTRGPQSALASSAMEELEKARLMFARAAKLSQRAAKALPVIVQLCEKARNAMIRSRSESPMSPMAGATWSTARDDTHDELTIFAGRTRLVSYRSGTGKQIQGEQSRTPEQSSSAQYYDGPNREMQPIALPVLPPFPNAGSSAPSQEGSWSSGYSRSHAYSNNRAPATLDSPQYSVSPVSPWQGESYAERRFAHTVSPIDAYQHQRPFSQPGAPYASNAHSYPAPPSELADLGLVSRQSRLDERWASFMQDSGVLDQNSFRPT
ncbi:hypothetical protein OE88DRAFT_518683 [Heliocybe sulcata]|uniref:Zn(2)-C6 fungal-type domain-containing protein n=1 Tax=Heliocybe sulcata TaxID=5364 RepID=A0A5C3MUC1_9AGAM|nr:hypothetical protein OE88DRAFT_518683 [Heliocybe sulcata]